MSKKKTPAKAAPAKQTPKPASSTKAAPAKAAKPAAPAKQSLIDVKETARIAAILTAICLIIALALAGTNMLTEDIIAQAEAEAKSATCYEVIPADGYVYLADHYDQFGYDAYLALHDGTVVGAAITTSAKGYGGAVTVMTGIDQNGCITGVSILNHSETAGLGANAAKPSFLGQFITAADAQRPTGFAVVKDGGEIDAVTAATVSSRAVSNAVTEALTIFAQLEEGGVIGAQIADPAPAPSATDAPVSNGDAPDNTNAGGESIG